MALRICIAAEHVGVGAAETYAFSLAAELSRRDHRVSLLTFESNLADATRWLEGTDVELRTLPVGTAARASAASGWMRTERPDVVHANHAASPVLIAAKRRSVPARIVTDHVLPLRPTYGIRGRALNTATVRSTNAVVVFSRQNARLARPAWPRLRIFMIHAGVPQPVARLSRDEARQSLNVPEGALVASLVGRLTEQKQQVVLVDAVRRLRSQGIDARAILAGEGEMRGSLEKLVKRLDQPEAVILTGHRNDVGTVLSATDIYVQPSAWEGLGFAVLEAMAFGLPVIVSDIPALREVVETTDTPIVEVGDAAAIASTLSSLARDPAKSHALASALKIRWGTTFTVDRMAAGHELAYGAVLGGTLG